MAGRYVTISIGDWGIGIGGPALITEGDREDAIISAIDEFGNPLSGLTINVQDFDASVISPQSNAVTIGADGTASLGIDGVAVGISPLLLQTPKGKQAQAQRRVDQPRLSITGSISVHAGGVEFGYIELKKADGRVWSNTTVGLAWVDGNGDGSAQLNEGSVQTDHEGKARFTVRGVKPTENPLTLSAKKLSAEQTATVVVRAVKITFIEQALNVTAAEGPDHSGTVSAVVEDAATGERLSGIAVTGALKPRGGGQASLEAATVMSDLDGFVYFRVTGVAAGIVDLIAKTFGDAIPADNACVIHIS